MHLLARILPTWLLHYPTKHLSHDVLAGLVTTVLVLPQSLAYALLAGLPPQAGLVVSIFPVMVYALLGSSMTQAVGPVAVTAIMTWRPGWHCCPGFWCWRLACSSWGFCRTC